MADIQFTYSGSLQDLLESETLSWIFVGGKGGVGKTTTSCSLAIQLASRRESVLLVSTDPAHNVSDAFGQKFSSKPLLVKGYENLYAMETDPTHYANSAFNLDEGENDNFMSMLPELISAFPGIDEAISFGKLMTFIQSLSFSTIVFDTAPTGHTLRLLSFPSLIEKAFSSMGGLGSQINTAFQMFSSMSGRKEEKSNYLEEIRANTNIICEMFSDPSKTTFVCVCIPEFLSVYETERLILELAVHNIDASFIVVNRILFPIEGCEECKKSTDLLATSPESQRILAEYKKLESTHALLNENYNARRRMQTKYLHQICDLYKDDFHIVSMPMQKSEVRGIDDLIKFGEQLLGEREIPIFESDED